MGPSNEEGKGPAKRRGGTASVPPPNPATASPLDAEGIKTNVTTKEIVRAIRESRQH